MRSPAILVLALSICALGACNKQPQAAGAGKGAGDAPQAGAAANLQMPQPGRYRTTTRIVDVAFPGMDAAMAGRMKGMFGAQGQSAEFCLTAQQAGKGYQEMTRRAAQGNCAYDSFKAEGGTLDAAMTCQTGRGMTTRSVLHGAFTSTGSHLQMTSDTSGAGMPGGGMHLQAEVVSERIGDCA